MHLVLPLPRALHRLLALRMSCELGGQTGENGNGSSRRLGLLAPCHPQSLFTSGTPRREHPSNHCSQCFFFSRGRETTRQTRQGSIFPQSRTVTRSRCVPPGVCLLGSVSRQQTGCRVGLGKEEFDLPSSRNKCSVLQGRQCKKDKEEKGANQRATKRDTYTHA